jgi:hypothetical protein
MAGDVETSSENISFALWSEFWMNPTSGTVAIKNYSEYTAFWKWSKTISVSNHLQQPWLKRQTLALAS